MKTLKIIQLVDQVGTPIFGANIIDKGDTYNGASSDFDGYFDLTAEPTTLIEITHQSYKTVQGTFSELPEIITMEENVNSLDEVVIIGTLDKTNYTTILLVIAVITKILKIW